MSQHNLPRDLDPFVGRKSLIADLCRLTRSGSVRLLTLTGTSALGKTRLALPVPGFTPDENARVCRRTGSGMIWDCAMTSYSGANSDHTDHHWKTPNNVDSISPFASQPEQ